MHRSRPDLRWTPPVHDWDCGASPGSLSSRLPAAGQRQFASLGGAGPTGIWLHGFLPLPSNGAASTLGSTPAFMTAHKIRQECRLKGAINPLKIKGFMVYMPQNSERLGSFERDEAGNAS